MPTRSENRYYDTPITNTETKLTEPEPAHLAELSLVDLHDYCGEGGTSDAYEVMLARAERLDIRRAALIVTLGQITDQLQVAASLDTGLTSEQCEIRAKRIRAMLARVRS